MVLKGLICTVFTFACVLVLKGLFWRILFLRECGGFWKDWFSLFPLWEGMMVLKEWFSIFHFSTNNPGRPIVNSIGSVTEKISAFVDEHLGKFTPRIPSYVKDTTHFINITNNIHLEPDDLLVTIDVSSLYTNIPNTESIAAINKMME